MARTQTTAQANANAAPRRKEFVRVFVENPDGGMTDVSAYFHSADISPGIDQPIAGATVRLRRDIGPTLSLSPLRTDSTLNRNAAAAYAPLLDVARAMYLEYALIDPSVVSAPAAGDWQRLFEGSFDLIDPAGSLVVCAARDLGARLQDTWLEEPTAVVVEGGTTMSMEAVIQQLLDTAFGAGVVTLYTPVSPVYTVTRFGYQREPVFDAILRLVQSIGWDCRYLWDSGTSSYRLTLYQPARTKTTPDHTLGTSRYIDLKKFAIARATIRNKVKVFFTTAAGVRDSITVNDTPSQLRYKTRPIIIEEAGDSVIDTATEATAMANALIADLKDPKTDGECEMPFFWPVELGDLIRFTTNGVHFNTSQDLAVSEIRHSLVTGAGQISKTTLSLRGSPAGAYRAWLARGGQSPAAVASRPVAWLSADTDTRALAILQVNGRAGQGVPAAPFQWRWRRTVNGVVGAWTTYVSTPLPDTISVSRDVFYQATVEVQVLQADGQDVIAVGYVPSRQDALAESSGKIARSVSWDDGDYGTRATTSDGLKLHAGGLDSRAAPLNNHFRYGTDSTVGVLASTGRAFIHDGYIDGTNRPVNLYSSVDGVVGVNAISDGAQRAGGAIADRVGGLALAAKDSRSAPLNAHFRYGTDSAAGVVESAGQSFINQSYLDASRRLVNVYSSVDGVVGANSIVDGTQKASNAIADRSGGLLTAAKDSRSAPLNAHFRYGTDSTVGVVATTGRGFVANVDGSNLITSSSSAGRSRARVDQNSQTVANATSTLLTFPSEAYKVGVIHSNTTASSRLTIPTGGDTGVWLFAANVSFQGKIAALGTAYGTIRSVEILKNTSAVVYVHEPPVPPDPGIGWDTAINCIFQDDSPTVGDYYEVRVYHDAGAAITVQAKFTAVHLW